MTWHAERLAGEPIAILTYTEPFDPERDSDEANQWFAKLEDELNGLIYRVADFRALNMKFAEIAVALSHVTNASVRGSLADPRIRGVVVSRDPVMKITEKALDAGRYGQARVERFNTLEEALAYVHQQIASQGLPGVP